MTRPPRLGPSRRTRRLVLGFTVACLALASALPAAEAGDSEEPEPASAPASVERVLIVSLPRLRWADVAQHRPLVLTQLLARSAVASLSVRTVDSVTGPGDAYATIGAGNRARAVEEVAGLAFAPGERYRGEAVAELFQRHCRCPMGDAAVLHLGVGAAAEANRRLRYGAELGMLSTVLARGGRAPAVVANADGSLNGGQPHREAALAAVDAEGRVAVGTVGRELLAADPSAPLGLRADRDETVASVAAAWGSADVVLLELADLERADRAAGTMTTAETEQARAAALSATDAVLGDVLAEVDLERDLVMVVAPTEPRAPPVELTIAAVAGPGFQPGLARSGSTRREGYVTLPDLAPTVLAALGMATPTTMSGAPVTAAGASRPVPELFEQLAGDNHRAVFRNRVTGPVTAAFIALQLLTYGLATVAIRRGGAGPRRLARFLALMVLGVPSVAFLSGTVGYDALGPVAYGIALYGVAAALAALAAVAGRRLGRRRQPGPGGAPGAAALLLAGLLLGILVVDIVVGGPLQIDTVFGYGGGAIVAGRFAGYGNLAFGLVAASAIVVTTGAWGWAAAGVSGTGNGGAGDEHSRPATRRRTGAVAALLAVTVLAIGLPALGLNVGGVLSAVPAFLVTLGVLRGQRLSWQGTMAMAGVTVAVIATFGVLDLARPPASRTHLGRFLSLVADQGVAGAATVIERKLASNLDILTSSVWTIVLPVALASLAVLALRARRRAVFPGALAGLGRDVRACLMGGLVLAVLGGLLNDSGVAVTAIVFAVLLPYLTVVVLTAGDTPSAATAGVA